jgi:hypothetical protein
VSPANFRQLLSRARHDLYQFMNNKCGLVNQSNPCRCARKAAVFMRKRLAGPRGPAVFQRPDRPGQRYGVKPFGRIAAPRPAACRTLSNAAVFSWSGPDPALTRDPFAIGFWHCLKNLLRNCHTALWRMSKSLRLEIGRIEKKTI